MNKFRGTDVHLPDTPAPGVYDLDEVPDPGTVNSKEPNSEQHGSQAESYSGFENDEISRGRRGNHTISIYRIIAETFKEFFDNEMPTVQSIDGRRKADFDSQFEILKQAECSETADQARTEWANFLMVTRIASLSCRTERMPCELKSLASADRDTVKSGLWKPYPNDGPFGVEQDGMTYDQHV